MTTLDRLADAIGRHEGLAIAVSGGVDSMLLTHVAHRTPARVVALHALSPAVPQEATARVKAHAARCGWSLRLIDAAELTDPDYVANPVNRCYFCKNNLYARIREATDLTIAAGTNADDLTDYRPGLDAARGYGVVHPFVEAGIGKASIYALAADLGLSDLAELPAQPCLASRIETGIAVDAETLAFIERTERALRGVLPAAAALRCRVTAAGVVAEASPLPAGEALARVEAAAASLCRTEGRRFAGLRAYRRGSAFLRPGA